MTFQEAYLKIEEFISNKTDINETRIKRDRYIFDEETVEYCKKEAEIILMLVGGGSQELRDILFDNYDFKLLFMFVKLFEDYSELMKVRRINLETFKNDNIHYREATLALVDDFIKEWKSKCKGSIGVSSVFMLILDATSVRLSHLN